MNAVENSRRKSFQLHRKKKNVAQLKAAVDLGISESQFRNVETGRCDPSAKLMFRMAKYFETTVEDLFPDLMEEDSEKTS
ncbi:helix-turn-helix domain-containing protein [Sporolactobacillus shoreicorticis]|uniref:Helix-turn-helix transcriptional regulator n=1 Tax=Sporolactobacillus shoreicorticis TaxID=1923877 RepID=A0ABW5RY80_9BACL|nr:helix-turn-helix transcriptional regulator [Sporolactobacillus shoreicorticis]MCO7125078.1 helix-turn-helix domain-containing protein [Sporolactobacillus shoreicorticis]